MWIRQDRPGGCFRLLITNETQLEALKGKDRRVVFKGICSTGRLQLSSQGWGYGVP